MVKVINRIPSFINTFEKTNDEILHNIGKFCKSKMEDYAPVDTGKLRSNCDYTVDSKNNDITVFNNTDYAGYQEYGTRNMKAQPFIRPSVYNHIREIEEIVRREYSNDTK